MDYKFEITRMTAELLELQKAYDEGHPEVTDEEYDRKYFALQKLENTFNYRLPNSPTQQVSFEVVSELKKVKHNHPMLSLAKTKELEEVASFLGEHESIAMCKMDGLTCSLRYEKGVLVGAETRGDGEIGEDILHNAYTVPSIPAMLPYDFTGTIDGEIICRYDDFEKINQNSEYKNPRNYASGSIRLLDANECSNRKLTFGAWDCIYGMEEKTLHGRLEHLKALGFKIVLYKTSDSMSLQEAVSTLQEDATAMSYPIDGIVFKFDNCEYYESLGRTDHHFKGGLAYKFYDELYDTRLLNIEYSMGRTGILTPVAIFEPIDIDGTIVERASLHNLSVMEEIMGKCRWVGQPIKVFKANQIIPQIAEAMHMDYGDIISKGGVTCDGFSGDIFCPCCGGGTSIEISESGVKNLICDNPMCSGKLLNRLDHFCGKKGLDIKGLSKKTLEKLIEWNWVDELADIISLDNHQFEWSHQSGFGEKSVDKVLGAIAEKCRGVELWQMISAAGIPTIGTTQSKILAKYFNTWDKFRSAADEHFNFEKIDGFGEVATYELLNFNYSEIDAVAKKVKVLDVKEKQQVTSLNGITVVITGRLKCGTRDKMKAAIEAAGGKVTGSVSGKTNYLINNDASSTTAKNKKALDLGVTIITEQEFIEKFSLDF